jgi:hypothetical protein
MHKAREMPKEEFKREVEKELTGKDTEPHEILYVKVYRSQIPVVEPTPASTLMGHHTPRFRPRELAWEKAARF